MTELKEVKFRFLCQGIFSVPVDQLPPGWPGMDAAAKWNWLQERWDHGRDWEIVNIVYEKPKQGTLF